MLQRDPKTHLGAFLGRKLQQARLAAGYSSQEKLAGRLHTDRTVITKIETGERPPSPETLAQWCEVTGITDPELYSELADIARVVSGAVPEWFKPWLEAETNCTSLRIWHPLILPGLFQVEEYAAEIIRKVDPGHLDELVATRLQRAKIFDRDDPPDVVAVISENVLRTRIGSAELMHGQLSHLLELSQRPRVVVQVLPSDSGAHAGFGGAFDLASGHGMNTLVRLEAVPLDVTTETPSVVLCSEVAFDQIRSEALTATQSQDLIIHLNEELWGPKV